MEKLFGYDVIKQLGKGKTGISYLVSKDGKNLVLKVMNKDVPDFEKQLEIFRSEKYSYEDRKSVV